MLVLALEFSKVTTSCVDRLVSIATIWIKKGRSVVKHNTYQ